MAGWILEKEVPMRRACIWLLVGLFALILSSSMAAAQDTKWIRDKETGERVKVKRSGSKWKVKETGKRYKIKESRSGAKVKKTGGKVRFEKRRGGKKEKKATPALESGSSSQNN
jgi:hypothetical protein